MSWIQNSVLGFDGFIDVGNIPVNAAFLKIRDKKK